MTERSKLCACLLICFSFINWLFLLKLKNPDWSEIHYVGLASISPCFSLFLLSIRRAEVCHHSQLQVVFMIKMQGNFSNTLVIIINGEKAMVCEIVGPSAGTEEAIPSHTGGHHGLHPHTLPVQRLGSGVQENTQSPHSAGFSNCH